MKIWVTWVSDEITSEEAVQRYCGEHVVGMFEGEKEDTVTCV
jgi:hypothetical protein